MQSFQQFFLVVFCVYACFGFFFGLKNSKFRKNPYGLTPLFYPLGAFVWADCIVFGIFFALIALISLFLQNWFLFLLFYSLFWTVRSIGEQMYWFLEQFASLHRNPENTLKITKIFPRNSSWIAMQIFWQCVSVISIIATVWCFRLILT